MTQPTIYYDRANASTDPHHRHVVVARPGDRLLLGAGGATAASASIVSAPEGEPPKIERADFVASTPGRYTVRVTSVMAIGHVEIAIIDPAVLDRITAMCVPRSGERYPAPIDVCRSAILHGEERPRWNLTREDMHRVRWTSHGAPHPL